MSDSAEGYTLNHRTVKRDPTFKAEKNMGLIVGILFFFSLTKYLVVNIY